MSLASSAADLWVDDLEDILGLDPSRRLEADHKRRNKRTPASLGLLYVAALAAGLTAVFVELNPRSPSTTVVQSSIAPARSNETNLPAALPSKPFRMAEASASIRPGESTYTTTSLADGDAVTRPNLDDRAAHPQIVDGERSATALLRQPRAQAAASAPALPSGDRSQRLPAERDGTILADAGNLPSTDEARLARTAPGIHVGRDAQPKSAAPADSLDAPAASSSSPPTPPSISGSPQGQPSDDTFFQEASGTPRSDASRKKRIRKTEAIDALRMLRRQ